MRRHLPSIQSVAASHGPWYLPPFPSLFHSVPHQNENPPHPHSLGVSHALKYPHLYLHSVETESFPDLQAFLKILFSRYIEIKYEQDLEFSNTSRLLRYQREKALKKKRLKRLRKIQSFKKRRLRQRHIENMKKV
eukprot:TRINITY_DN7891_c0_g1_i1.p1 TRINITY_DN7891_c0_g1~~TRINITY_DN7891_c0_g1_i1.p1  ORF type:complete len:135 (+),score=16.93 TRINITY_DN7891_c0_g1_i1:239-643(+)